MGVPLQVSVAALERTLDDRQEFRRLARLEAQLR